MAPNVSPISDTQSASSLNPCNVEMTVSIRRGRKGKWREAREGDKVVSGNEIEVLASCGCRAMIDIKPDGRYQPIGVLWSEMMFIPDEKTPTRYKIAYYKPRRIRRTTRVIFTTTAQCRCRDCASGVDVKSFTLMFEGDDSI